MYVWVKPNRVSCVKRYLRIILNYNGNKKFWETKYVEMFLIFLYVLVIVSQQGQSLFSLRLMEPKVVLKYLTFKQTNYFHEGSWGDYWVIIGYEKCSLALNKLNLAIN